MGVYYTKLRDLLAKQKWKEADQETCTVMLKVAGREKERWLDSDSIKKFPCEDLRTINQLWLKYSNNRFGFSVQKDIWLQCGGKIDYDTECKIGDSVGWRVDGRWLNYDEINFSLDAPPGHLPGVGRWDGDCFGGLVGCWWLVLGGFLLSNNNLDTNALVKEHLAACDYKITGYWDEREEFL